MKTIAFIDCFVNTPVNHSVNSYSLHTDNKCTYHMPSVYGLKSLEQLEETDAYIILGSASHITEKLNWHKELLDFIIPKIEANIPTLGICFGHQLIADYYGCEVGYIYKDKQMLTEVRDIQITEESMGLKVNENYSIAFAHSQIVKNISEQFISFANSSLSQYEALKHKSFNYWSFQAHPEASKVFLKDEVKLSTDETISQTQSQGFHIIDMFCNQF